MLHGKESNLVVKTVENSSQLTERLCSESVVEDTVDVHHKQIVCFVTDLQILQMTFVITQHWQEIRWQSCWIFSIFFFVRAECWRASKEQAVMILKLLQLLLLTCLSMAMVAHFILPSTTSCQRVALGTSSTEIFRPSPRLIWQVI